LKEQEQIHIFFRDVKGRFVTHFLFPKEKWDLLEEILRMRRITINDVLMEYATSQINLQSPDKIKGLK
jgi:hypothetical protein